MSHQISKNTENIFETNIGLVIIHNSELRAMTHPFDSVQAILAANSRLLCIWTGAEFNKKTGGIEKKKKKSNSFYYHNPYTDQIAKPYPCQIKEITKNS